VLCVNTETLKLPNIPRVFHFKLLMSMSQILSIIDCTDVRGEDERM
jgi:hypothetical protein